MVYLYSRKTGCGVDIKEDGSEEVPLFRTFTFELQLRWYAACNLRPGVSLLQSKKKAAPFAVLRISPSAPVFPFLLAIVHKTCPLGPCPFPLSPPSDVKGRGCGLSASPTHRSCCHLCILFTFIRWLPDVRLGLAGLVTQGSGLSPFGVSPKEKGVRGGGHWGSGEMQQG